MSRFWLTISLVLLGVLTGMVTVAQMIGASLMSSSVVAYKSWGGDLYLVDLEYGIRLVIIPASIYETAGISLSSDSRWLVYVLNDGERDIYVIDLETGTTQNFTNNHSYAYFYNPIIWSPNGRWIAFVSNLDSEDTEIYVLDFHSGTLRQLTHNDVDDDVPAWSANSQFIAYVENPLAEAPRIRLIDVETGTIENLINDDILNLTWSFDGQWIAYTDWVENNLDVLAVNVATGESINLTNNPSWDGSPAWSPNRNWLAFESDRNGNRDIYLLDIANNELLNLTPDSVSDSYPQWSSNGRWLLFNSEIGMRALNIETREMRVLPNR